MPYKTGNNIYGLDGTTYRLSQEVGSGHEGSVWTVDGHPSLVAKLYHSAMPPQQAGKLEVMSRLRTDALTRVAAWPITLVKDSKAGVPQGLLMRRVSGHQSVNQLYGIKSRLRAFPEAQFPFLVHVAANIARAFATIHDAGQVIGDVNHSNLMVAQNGTVVLIDCDSFQIRDGSTIYPCRTGTPEFTPPEIQGVTFVNQRRTVEHDSFGLSVLIFYLLFLGRHPYMGLFDVESNDMVSLDAAIGAYKFPYALGEQSPEVRLPPFLPRLNDFPSQLQALFKQAFTRESQSRGRPSAQEWVAALDKLGPSARQCLANPNHHHFGLGNCPWCKVEGAIGSAVFGVKIVALSDGSFSVTTIWAEIEGVVPVREGLTGPDLQSLRHKYQPDASIPRIVHRRRVFRISAVLLALGVSVIAVAFTAPALAIAAIMGVLFAGCVVWSKGSAEARPFAEAYADAAQSFRTAETAFDQSGKVPESYRKAKERLKSAKLEFEGLSLLKASRIRALESARESKQRQHFLEKFRLEDERIPNVGDKTKAILYTWGILDAWDIEASKISQIKGFGPVKLNSLLAWRAEKERQFRFNPGLPVDPRDLLAIEQEFQQKAIKLRSILLAGPQELRQCLSVWQAQRRQLLSSLFASAERLAAAEVNRNALRKL